MATLAYREGDVFGVPFGSGYGLGVVARVGKRGRIVLGYFFDVLFETLPSGAEVPSLRPRDAAFTIRFGDLHLVDGRWPVICQIRPWERETWPMPMFVRVEPTPSSDRFFLVSYPDIDPSQPVKLERIDSNSANYERDWLWGAGAVEARFSSEFKIL
jgi:hypothetical protein